MCIIYFKWLYQQPTFNFEFYTKSTVERQTRTTTDTTNNSQDHVTTTSRTLPVSSQDTLFGSVWNTSHWTRKVDTILSQRTEDASIVSPKAIIKPSARAYRDIITATQNTIAHSVRVTTKRLVHLVRSTILLQNLPMQKLSPPPTPEIAIYRRRT